MMRPESDRPKGIWETRKEEGRKEGEIARVINRKREIKRERNKRRKKYICERGCEEKIGGYIYIRKERKKIKKKR